MRTVDVKSETGPAPARPSVAERAKATTQHLKTRPDILAGRVILAGAGAVVGLVIVANIAPYTRLANLAIATTLDFKLLWLGRLIGVCGLAAVQVGEVFSYTMHRPNRQAYAATGLIALLAYGIDAAIAIWAWNPLRVSLADFIAVPLIGSINWQHCIIIGVLLFGVEGFIRLCQLVNQSNRSQD